MLPAHDTCTVYHGTNLFAAKIIEKIGIRLDVQRELTDFGKGFYVTLNLQQAKNWAQIRAMHPQISPHLLDLLNMSQSQYFHHPEIKIPACLVYELNVKQLRQLNGKEFSLPHEPGWVRHQRSWEQFVFNCRTGKRHDYDYVYGPVAKGHLTNMEKIKVSHTKDQLSLNSMRAVNCLTTLDILVFKPEDISMKAVLLKQLWSHRQASENVRNDRFLREIRDELMTIGNLTSRQADQMLRQALTSLPFSSMIMHEPAAYWAFSILYGMRKLWHKEYEVYMKKKNEVRK
ncbi:hypothetical protein B1690_12640 [Geobacillus sp. 46C-IIa]|uniref:DUF3990 domain-containing protein n=1 Tax=Geobacillus sp. 46C-IIa TaxID=1963025 RepID=UPI0009BF4091|nr:DUF3990 domain-containing protein [Geobacillus sp. 46C-IIa]OQP05695.1 hypothetical protein B1690_12640 [Geobacillus sp. 46C-IIa]QNU27607.1 DUF3990 domain-containing protein [Geobacillus sp. 46C-IIa]